jgi:REP element-mobilizing transposase RayT
MSTYSQSIIQIVFSTKLRESTLIKSERDELFKYIWGVISHKKCHLYRIGGIENHIHIATSLSSTITVADLVKDIKLASSDYIKRNNLFPDFGGWQNGYSWFTYSYKDKDRLIEYIKNQEKHHHEKSYKDELIDLLNEHGVEFDEKYLL